MILRRIVVLIQDSSCIFLHSAIQISAVIFIGFCGVPSKTILWICFQDLASCVIYFCVFRLIWNFICTWPSSADSTGEQHLGGFTDVGALPGFPIPSPKVAQHLGALGPVRKAIFLFNGFIQRIPLCRPIWQDSCLCMFLLTRQRKQGSCFLGLKLSLSIQIRMHRLWDETTRSCVRPLCFDVLKWSLFETSVKGKRPTLYTLWTKMTGTKTEEKTFGEIFDFGKVMMGKFRPQGTWQF